MTTLDDPGIVRESTLGALPTLVLETEGTSAVIALRGATLLSWSVPGPDGAVELIDGYADEDEFTRQDGMRSALMVPFSNRVSGDRYVFEGREISFGRDAELTPPGLLHGLLRTQDYELVAATRDGSRILVELRSSALRPGAFEGYPFAVDVAVTFALSPGALEIEVTGSNVGTEAAPYSSGWHPYFRLGDATLADLQLRVPARARVVTGDDLIPLAGAEAVQRLGGYPRDELDFSDQRPIGDLAIDVCYVDVEPSPDSLIHSTLSHPSEPLRLDVWQERGHVHVYTADALERGPRRSLAIEPVESLTNAVNRPDQADVIRLEAGASRAFRFGVKAQPTV